jgi:hypothetical protein
MRSATGLDQRQEDQSQEQVEADMEQGGLDHG